MVRKDQTQCLQDLHHYGILNNTREIFLNSDYNNSDGNSIDFRMAVTLQKNLRFLDSVDDKGILIHLNSDGGSFSDGMAIYDAIRTAKSHITILAYGEASSMASVILQAADLRILMPSCYLMIHNSSVDLGTSSLKTVLSTSSQMLVEHNWMLKIYANRMISGPFNQSKKDHVDQIIRLISDRLNTFEDWYISPEESVDLGLADSILGLGKYKYIRDLLDI